MTRPEILQHIRRTESSYPPSNLTSYLKALQDEDHGAIIQYDTNSGKFSFSNPFHKVFARVLFNQSTSAANIDQALDRLQEFTVELYQEIAENRLRLF